MRIIANRITTGDVHDRSIEHFMKTTDFEEYHIYRKPNERFEVIGGPIEPPEPAPNKKPPIVKTSKKKKKK